MKPDDKSENSKVLADFVAYCETHPTERFWQALRNWSGHNFIVVTKGFENTFHWRGKSE